jgi:hypothetical protein
VIKFILNATVNWLKTPDMMKIWGYKKTAYCALCNHSQCTLHHIISDCPTALNQGRYTWRHDSILEYLAQVVQEIVDKANTREPEETTVSHIDKNFVRAGAKPPVKRHKNNGSRGTLLREATDWKALVDLDNKMVYPPEIFGTPQRPDIVIWSPARKRVLNIEAAQTRKEGRYFPLKCDPKDRGWDSLVATLEVGARGFVARTVPRTLKRLGREPKEISADMRNLSNLVARCTYGIYLARESTFWDPKRERLTIQGLASTAIPKPPENESHEKGW